MCVRVCNVVGAVRLLCHRVCVNECQYSAARCVFPLVIWCELDCCDCARRQESWRMVVGTHGPDIVAANIGSVIPFYMEQCCHADNHGVREAACYCIAELGHKIDKAVVAPHVPALIACFLGCFRDDAWPVCMRVCMDWVGACLCVTIRWYVVGSSFCVV